MVTRTCAQPPSPIDARVSSGSSPIRPHRCGSRRRRSIGPWPSTGSRCSRAPAWTASSGSGRAIRTSRASARWPRSSTPGRPIASWQASAGTRTGRERSSARSCSGSTTTRGSCSRSASRPRSRWPSAPSWSSSWSPTARAEWRTTRGATGRWPRPPAVEQGRRLPGAQSRWNRGKDLSWEPLRPELVCEVAFDHLQGDRFRHGTTFRRWRPDRSPADCRYDQLEETPAALLADLFGG